MKEDAPTFPGFPNPWTGFVMISHTFFRWLRHFEENEIPVLLSIFKHTWGWQKVFAKIPESQIIKEVGMSRTTVRKALRSLEASGVIRRYQVGIGRSTKTYFFIANDKSDQLYQAILSGQMSIDQAQDFNSFKVMYPKINPKNGSKVDPKNGSDFDPNSGGRNGSRIEPMNMKKKEFKKTDSKKAPDPPDPRPEIRDERLHRMMINQKRRRAGYNGRPTQIKNAMQAAYADLQSLRQATHEISDPDHTDNGPPASESEPGPGPDADAHPDRG